ncbi:biotin transporter BioY [Candidatus Dependentiae bacterium]|nr:biotin transporter BioY [Candidatus Dependentiae bacterium]
MNATRNLTLNLHTTYHKIKTLHLDWLVIFPLFFFITSQIILPLPFSPVPVSLQPFPVFLVAWFFGFRGIAGYFAYLLEGALSAPIFFGFSGGLAHLMGPTGGYLLGFLPGAIIIVYAKKHMSFQSLIAKYGLYTLATLITFISGVSFLTFFISIKAAIVHGFIPFIIGDFLFKPTIFTLIASCFKK